MSDAMSERPIGHPLLRWTVANSGSSTKKPRNLLKFFSQVQSKGSIEFRIKAIFIKSQA